MLLVVLGGCWSEIVHNKNNPQTYLEARKRFQKGFPLQEVITAGFPILNKH